MKKVVVILSGGMDSATVLALALSQLPKENVYTMTFQYGSKHNARELLAVQRLTHKYGVHNEVVYLPFLNQLFKSDLLLSGGEIPEGHYQDLSMKRTVVPFRNGIMLAIAAGYAESIGADELHLGNHAGDHTIYPDCRMSFILAMQQAIEQGTYAKVKLLSPFCNDTKTEIVITGQGLKVPYELTYSCYKGEQYHCGKCGTCYERKEAFRDSGVPDLTIYEGCFNQNK